MTEPEVIVKNYKLKFVVRTGTTTQWDNTDRILEAGEFGYDRTLKVTKMGDGYNFWPDLPIFGNPAELVEEIEEVFTNLSNQIAVLDAYSRSLINDVSTTTTKTWSSNEIMAQISAQLNALIGGAPGYADTLGELNDLILETDDQIAGVILALSSRLRVDAPQLLSSGEKAYGRSNLGLGTAAVADAADFETAGSSAASIAYLKSLIRPFWVPDDAAAATADTGSTTLSNVAMPSGTAYASLCQWFGDDNTVPSAVRFVVGAFATVTLFRLGIYDDSGVLRYVTSNLFSDVGSNGTKTALLTTIDATPKTFVFGELFSLGWISVGGTPGIPRFTPASSAVGSLGTVAPKGRIRTQTGQADLPSTLTGWAQGSSIFLGQILK